MHLVRYLAPGGHDPLVGVLTDGFVLPVTGTASMAELLGCHAGELRERVSAAAAGGGGTPVDDVLLLPPLDGRAEVWCSGVTYERSRGARVEETSERSVYDKVYDAQRPELFVKAPAWRVVTDGEPIGIREDSGHDVPEPELALVLTAHGEIVGYTVCNDVSSRSIEGENPLYIPQAKVFSGGCAVAAGIRPAWEVPDAGNLEIRVDVVRAGEVVFEGTTSTSLLHRTLDGLARTLFSANDFPDGVLLATGTGIVPELDFTLQDGDRVDIDIADVGRLSNRVTVGRAPLAWLVDAHTDPAIRQEVR